jgi:stress response protein YsnF
MSWLERVNVGMPVRATDGLLGSVVSVPRVDLDDPTAPAELIVLVSGENGGPGVEEFRRVARDMIARVEPKCLVLNVARRGVPRASSAVTAAHRGLHGGETFRIPVHEEEVHVNRRVVELGHVTIRKKVDELLDEQVVTLRQQDVQLERVPVDRVLDEPLEPYVDDDGAYVVPVIEEEVIVTRRLRLKELLRIHRVVGEHDELIQTPFRRERVLVSEHWLDDATAASATQAMLVDADTGRPGDADSQR